MHSFPENTCSEKALDRTPNKDAIAKKNYLGEIVQQVDIVEI